MIKKKLFPINNFNLLSLLLCRAYCDIKRHTKTEKQISKIVKHLEKKKLLELFLIVLVRVKKFMALFFLHD